MKETHNSKVDPSGIKQEFTGINMKLHCCRYWKLKHWEFHNMSFPFWRLYYNTIEGAKVIYKNKQVSLNANNVVLISPHTSFSTSLKELYSEKLSGSRIESKNELLHLSELGMTDHLFLHFNLGFQLDHLQPDIYEFHVTPPIRKALDSMRFSMIDHYQKISCQDSLTIYALIFQLIVQIPEQLWKEHSVDYRVMKVIKHIDVYYAQPLSNSDLATIANMAPNSFLRLFKASTGFTIQNYIQNKRVEKAILSMHNENLSIEEIAEQNGFCDRFNFSKVFKRQVNVSPAQYRKQHTLK